MDIPLAALKNKRATFLSMLVFEASTVIDTTINQDRLCSQAYSLRLFATINPAG
jgi:hypothetical protein